MTFKSFYKKHENRIIPGVLATGLFLALTVPVVGPMVCGGPPQQKPVATEFRGKEPLTDMPSDRKTAIEAVRRQMQITEKALKILEGTE